MTAIDEMIQRRKLCCRRNKYYCKSCAELIDSIHAAVAAGKWRGYDSMFDLREPIDPRDVEANYEPLESRVSRLVVTPWRDSA